MLGRLKMSIDECIKKYDEFMKIVFPDQWTITKWGKILGTGQKWSAQPLEDVVKQLIKERLKTNHPEDIQLMDENSKNDPCKV